MEQFIQWVPSIFKGQLYLLLCPKERCWKTGSRQPIFQNGSLDTDRDKCPSGEKRVLWLELGPTGKFICWSPKPSTSECDLILRWCLYRSNPVKMRSQGWTWIQYDWGPHKKGKFGHRHTYVQGRMPCDHHDSHLQGMCQWLTITQTEAVAKLCGH